jgi:hypothetical protein
VQRVVAIDVESVVEQECALPVRFALRHAYDPNPPLPPDRDPEPYRPAVDPER